MRRLFALALLFFTIHADAGDIVVNDASARATAPGQENATVQISITSKQDGRVVRITSSIADSVEIHSMMHVNGMMKMRALEFLPLPAGQTVKLGSGGNHVMLISIKNQLKAGDSVPLSISVEFADKSKETVSVNAEVKSRTGSHGEHEHH